MRLKMSTRPSGCWQLSGPRPPGLSVHTLVHIGLQRPPGAWSHPDRPVLPLTPPLPSRSPRRRYRTAHHHLLPWRTARCLNKQNIRKWENSTGSKVCVEQLTQRDTWYLEVWRFSSSLGPSRLPMLLGAAAPPSENERWTGCGILRWRKWWHRGQTFMNIYWYHVCIYIGLLSIPKI